MEDRIMADPRIMEATMDRHITMDRPIITTDLVPAAFAAQFHKNL